MGMLGVVLGLIVLGAVGWRMLSTSHQETVTLKRAKRTASYEVRVGRLEQIKDMAESLADSIGLMEDSFVITSKASTLNSMITMYDRNEGKR